jgi:hypothetical protein
MFTTNLNIIIITGTGAGHEPQNKGLRPEELSSTVMVRTESAHGLVVRAPNWGHESGLPPVYHRGYTARTRAGFVPVDGTQTSRKARHHHLLSISIPGGGFFLHRRTTKASSEKGMDSARRHHLHPSSRLLFGRSVSSLSASQVASLSPAGQLTKREVNRLHRRSRDEKTELNRRVPQSRYFSGRRKHCRVLGLNREPLSTSVSIVPHCQEGNMSKVFNH